MGFWNALRRLTLSAPSEARVVQRVPYLKVGSEKHAQYALFHSGTESLPPQLRSEQKPSWVPRRVPEGMVKSSVGQGTERLRICCGVLILLCKFYL